MVQYDTALTSLMNYLVTQPMDILICFTLRFVQLQRSGVVTPNEYVIMHPIKKYQISLYVLKISFFCTMHNIYQVVFILIF